MSDESPKFYEADGALTMRMGGLNTPPMRENCEMSMEELFGEVIYSYTRLCARQHKREYVAM